MDRKRSKQLNRTFLSGDGYWQVNKKVVKQLGANTAIAIADLLNVEKMFEESGKLPKDEWFFQSIEMVQKHTGLSRKEQETAYAKLRCRKFIEQINKGRPRRRWFRIDHEQMFEWFANLEDEKEAEDDRTQG